MNNMTELSDASIDEHNVNQYTHLIFNKRDSNFICKGCKKHIDLSGSYSNNGLNLYCSSCVENNAKHDNMHPIDWCIENIWICNNKEVTYDNI